MKNIRWVKELDRSCDIADQEDLKLLITKGVVIAKHKTSVRGEVHCVGFRNNNLYLTSYDMINNVAHIAVYFENLMSEYDLKWINTKGFTQ